MFSVMLWVIPFVLKPNASFDNQYKCLAQAVQTML